ncbi:MAG: HNH endonuclease [Thalassospira sp.]|uniref:HNH endonuclease n=1 Tax=Thalassospira sp. TaxID=1912094 RepID=UPI0032EC279E
MKFLKNTSPAFWWVNHKQTFKQEIEGGYIWSPKRKQNGDFNQTYENMRYAKPGDIVMSYANTQIKAIGVVTASATDQGKPAEFGQGIGENWSKNEGWLVPVEWALLAVPIVPKAHLEQIAPLLPDKHAPLQTNGNGNQSCYLARISPELGNFLLYLVEIEQVDTASFLKGVIEEVQGNLVEQEIIGSERLKTEKEQLIKSRQGQGVFRQRVMIVEKCCRITGVADERLLIASHIKPWKTSDDRERLDGENGLFLAPHVDKLFDKGWISFTDAGDLLFTDRANAILTAWHINPNINVGSFTDKQRLYMSYHRQEVFQET